MTACLIDKLPDEVASPTAWPAHIESRPALATFPAARGISAVRAFW